jgi:hypothetical protein
MPDDHPTERRSVRSADPNLSPRANELLTGELRDIIGSDEVDVPVGRADPAHRGHTRHTPWIADVIDARVGWAFTLLAAICTGAIIAIVLDSTVILIAAIAVLFVTTLLAWRLVQNLTAEAEHPDPETAALLEEEGVGDPARVLEDLVEEFTPPPPDEPRST